MAWHSVEHVSLLKLKAKPKPLTSPVKQMPDKAGRTSEIK